MHFHVHWTPPSPPPSFLSLSLFQLGKSKFALDTSPKTLSCRHREKNWSRGEKKQNKKKRSSEHLSPPSQPAFGFVRGAFIIIRNVIALLLLKDRGRGGGIRLGDMKYVRSINVQPTSSLYISTAACDFLTWWSYYIPLTPGMSYVSEHNRCRSLLHPRVEMSINTRPGLCGRTRLITEAAGLA